MKKTTVLRSFRIDIETWEKFSQYCESINDTATGQLTKFIDSVVNTKVESTNGNDNPLTLNECIDAIYTQYIQDLESRLSNLESKSVESSVPSESSLSVGDRPLIIDGKVQSSGESSGDRPLTYSDSYQKIKELINEKKNAGKGKKIAVNPIHLSLNAAKKYPNYQNKISKGSENLKWNLPSLKTFLETYERENNVTKDDSIYSLLFDRK